MILMCLVALILLIQVSLMLVCFFGQVGIVQKIIHRRWLAFLIGECIFVLFIFVGAYGEARWEGLTQLRSLLFQENAIFLPKRTSVDDPGLLKLVQFDKPGFSRPDFSSLARIQEWQYSARTLLVESLFKISDFSVKQKVSFQIISSETLSNNVMRTMIVFKSFDGTNIPAFILKPYKKASRPGILVIPGHVSEKESGIQQTSGLGPSYQHQAALRLAEAGFVTMSFELRGFGSLGSPYNTEHRLVAYNAILAGSFYKAIISRDIKFAIDLLQSFPEVQPKRIGIAGVSLGGELAVTYGAMDERIKAIVFQGFGGELGIQKGVEGTSQDQPHYCHVIPGFNHYFHQEDLFYLLAPRPVLGVRGSRDKPFSTSFKMKLKQAWETFHSPTALKLQTSQGGHEFFVEAAKGFFQKYL